MVSRFFCSLFFVMVLVAPVSAGRAPEALTLDFGLYQSDKATEMYRTFTPAIEALQESMTEILGMPVEIETRIFKTYKEALDALVTGDIDFARFGPASYVLSKDRSPEIGIVAMENKKGKRSYKGVIAVRADCPAQTLQDLKGNSFAFGDSNSSSGRFLSQSELLTAGVSGSDLKYQYLGRHDRVAKAVAVGDFYAGAMKESSFKKANTSGALRVLISFDCVAKPWLVRAGLDVKVTKALERALLEMKDPKALKSLKVDGFFPGEDHYYDVIRKSIHKAGKF